MRYLVALAALALLGLAAWVSWGGNDDRANVDVACNLPGGRVCRTGEPRPPAWRLSHETPDSLVPWLSPSGDGIGVAGVGVVELPVDIPSGVRRSNSAGQATQTPSAPSEGGVDAGLSEDAAGEPFLITIFCCKGDSTGAYCPVEEGGQATASGISVSEVDPETGARMVACSQDWAFGTQFLVAGEFLMVCQDRGSAVVNRTHLDAYFYACGNYNAPKEGEGWAWLQKVGTQVEVEVLE